MGLLSRQKETQQETEFRCLQRKHRWLKDEDAELRNVKISNKTAEAQGVDRVNLLKAKTTLLPTDSITYCTDLPDLFPPDSDWAGSAYFQPLSKSLWFMGQEENASQINASA